MDGDSQNANIFYLNRKSIKKDFQIRGTFTDNNKFRLCFMPLQPNSGVQILNKLLYMAPDNGYKDNVVIEIEASKIDNLKSHEKYREKYYLYMQLQGRQIYARFEIVLSGYHGSSYLNIEIRKFSNPTGSRYIGY